MTIKDCIDSVDNIKPNQYTIKDKVLWLSFIEETIINDVLKTHEGYDGRYDNFEGYSEDKISVTLIVPAPYDRLYMEYLKMMIDKENGEITRYNNSAASFNTYMREYRKYYNKTHMPINILGNVNEIPPKKTTGSLSDAEYENIKKDLLNVLSEQLNEMVSADKLSYIVNQYLQNNMGMFKSYVDKSIKNFSDSIPNPTRSFVNILGGAKNWFSEKVFDAYNSVVGTRYGQVVNVNNAVITPNSKIDLQITSEQMVVFHEKDLAFVAENEDGVVTIYCIGSIPQNDYTIQAIVTEVVVNA